jgi:serralysin
MQQYRDFLRREGDTGGVNFWTGTLSSGSFTREQVIDNFFSSTEFQNSTAPVVRLLFASFLRVPTTRELSFWVTQFRNHTGLRTIAETFSLSQEFLARYDSLSNRDFVSAVYNNVLERPPDSGGLSFWTGQLDSGAVTRGQVILSFSGSSEFRSLILNEVFLTQIYAGMLARAPDPGGFDFWRSALDSGLSRLNAISAFMNSAEYRSRFLA